MDSSVDIEEKAAAWVAKRDGGVWSQADQAELNDWLKPTAHRVAYLRLEAALRKMGRLQALGAGAKPGVMPAPGEWTLSPFFQQMQATSAAKRRVAAPKRLWFAVAASVMVAVVLGVAGDLFPGGGSYRTQIGAIQAVPMSDGSLVTLNTDSKIRIEVNEKERRIELDHGEAFFEVAKDSARPFIVSVGSERVIAVGTKFSVRRDAGGLRVAVTEGKVRIEGSGTNGFGMPAEITAGGVARSGGEGVLIQERPVEEVEQSLSWRSGYLMFRGTPLAEAVAEFNRYTERKIVIEDPALADVRIGGNFRSTNVGAFLRLLHDGFAIEWVDKGATIVLTDAPQQ